MTNLSEKILLSLVKKYERSSSFKDNSNNKRRIFLSLKDEILSNFYSSSLENLEQYKKTFEELKESGFVYFEGEESPKFKIILITEKIEEIYKILKVKNLKKALFEETNLILEKIEIYKNNEVLQVFLEKCLYEIENFHFPKSLYKTHEMLEVILKSIDGIMSNKEEILLRNLSVKLFSDSKILEKNGDLIFQRVKQFSNFQFNNFYEFCDYFNVTKNTGFVLVKGNIILNLNGEIIDLNKLNSVFAIPSTFLNKGLIKNISVNKVMTIENETTFNYLTDPSYLYVFSKGHPTKKVINFLKIVKESSNDIKFYHCGDIDWGGFNIYFDLLEKTGIDFELYNMDSITLEKFKRFAKPLSDIDKRNLLSLKEKDKVKKNQNIAKTIDFMLENNLKLEQEAIN